MFSLFAKGACTATVAPSNEVLSVKRGDKLLDAALAAGLAWPHDCRVGSCGTCRCLLTSGKIKALTDFSYTLTPAEIQAGAILACQVHLRSDVTVEVALGAPTIKTQTAWGTIETLRALTHDILEVTVKLEEPAFADAVAGQYLELHADGLDAPRSYSLLRAPRFEATARVTFCIRHIP
ncbi:MAG: 2Fe-2S iron-sulfur cluster binding domain-containing protein, partial [Gammaproteobacteria bacterium]|nr:2Fe-2S iron-sulfur cluster binding domain-containing protein [Gammaproteobacteria bacterium]